MKTTLIPSRKKHKCLRRKKLSKKCLIFELSLFSSWPCLNWSPEPNFPSILPQEPRHPTWPAFIIPSPWLRHKQRRPKPIICKAYKDTRSTTLGLPFPKDTSGNTSNLSKLQKIHFFVAVDSLECK